MPNLKYSIFTVCYYIWDKIFSMCTWIHQNLCILYLLHVICTISVIGSWEFIKIKNLRPNKAYPHYTFHNGQNWPMELANKNCHWIHDIDLICLKFCKLIGKRSYLVKIYFICQNSNVSVTIRYEVTVIDPCDFRSIRI